MPRLALYFLGTPRLERDGEQISLSHHKSLALLAYLAVTRQAHTRQTLAALLWPDFDPDSARGELRRMLWVLNKSLGQGWLEATREMLLLPSHPDLWLDIERFRALLTTGQQHGHPVSDICPACQEPLIEAIELARGDFLAGFTLPDSSDFDTWQTFETESLRRELAGALERLVQLLLRFGTVGEPAISYARRWLALDPLHEPAHRRLMQLYAWSGQPAAAIQQYQTCAQVLEQELGMPPSAETIDLLEQIKTNRLLPPTQGQPQKTAVPASPQPADPPHNLPVQATPFIGRESALDGLQQRLADPEVRLITIIGPGGIGKTRLALAVAERQLKTKRKLRLTTSFSDGIYFISLAPLRSAEAVVQTIAEGVGFPLVSAEEPATQLLTYLRHKQMLLLLDNFEHVLAGAAFVSQILQTAVGVKMLVTSRERLNLAHENLWPIGGLNFAGLTSVEEALTYEAVRLFIQRARQVRPDFVLRAEDLPYLEHVLQGVWGMPLAIELAAAWLNMLSLAEVAAELNQGLDLLESELSDIPGRHRSMRLVFDRSWERLAAEEQAQLKRLSIFRGGFTREAAQQITGASLRLLAGLVNKSLLSSQPDSERYELHELIRQYAAMHFQQDTREEQAVGDRHSHYYLTLLQTHEPALRSSRQKDVFTKLKPDIDNIRLAWDVALAHEKIDLLSSTTGSLFYFYELHQYFQEAESLFRRGAEMARQRIAALDMNDSSPERTNSKSILGQMLAYQAFFYQRLGRNREAVTIYKESIALLRPLNETFILTYALVMCGIAYWSIGDFEEAAQSLHEGLPLSRELEQPWLQTLATGFLGAVTHDRGDYAVAYRWLDEAIALCRGMEDPYMTLLIGVLFNRTAERLGRLTEGQDLLRESYRIARETDNRWGIGLGLECMAVIAQTAGNEDQVRPLLEESTTLHREVGDHWSLSRALTSLSRLALSHLEIEAAERYAVEGFQAAMEGEYTPNALDALAILATVRARLGLNTAAVEMALHIQRHPASTQEAKDRAENLQSALVPQLMPQQLEAVQAQVQARSFATAMKELVDPVVTS